MALGDIMRNSVRVTLEGRLSPRQLGIVAGTTAKTRHEQLMAEGIVPQTFQRYVNGVVGAPETALRFGVGTPGEILYKGSSLAAAAIFALQFCRQLSPVLTGAYSRAWILALDDLIYTGPLERIPPAVKATIVNYAPYSRRLEQSYGRTRPAYHVTQIAVDTTKRRFSGLSVRRQFITLSSIPNASKWQVPYVLKRPPGGVMLYPAVVIQA